MKARSWGLALACCLTFISTLTAQESRYRFTQLGTKDGLSHSLVNPVIEDDLGYIWVGTQDGLNRYDGYGFEVFRPDGTDQGIYYQWINGLYKDRQGLIWIRYWTNTVGFYDPVAGRFHNFVPSEADPHSLPGPLLHANGGASANFFLEDDQNRLWLATSRGICRYRRDTRDFDPIRFEGIPGLEQPHVVAMRQDAFGVMWVATTTGLIRYEPESGAARLVYSVPQTEGNTITKLMLDRQQRVWFGTLHNGLFRLPTQASDPQTIEQWFDDFMVRERDEVAIQGLFQDRIGDVWVGTSEGLFRFGAANMDKPVNVGLEAGMKPEHPIQYFEEDVMGRIWLASDKSNRLWQYDPQPGQWLLFEHNPLDPQSLGPNHIKHLYEDSKGVLWVAHEKGGLTMLNLFQQPFHHIHNTKAQYRDIPNNDIYGIYVDEASNLWLGSNGGLYHQNLETGKQQAFTEWKQEVDIIYGKSRLPSGRLPGVIKPDGKGNLWLGYFDYKISLFNPRNPSFVNWYHAPEAPGAFGMWSLRDILLTRDGETYFVGTNGGLYRLNPDGKTFRSFAYDPEDENSLSEAWVYRLMEDADGFIWLGTRDGGLNRFDPQTEQVIRWQHIPHDPQSLSSNTIKAMIEGREAGEKILWIGTENGLNKFNPRTGISQRFGREEGMPSTVIHGMLEDDRGQIWISTNGGLACFNPRTESFFFYTKADGLQDDEFNEGACFKDHNGWLYFGGVNGVTAFHPDSLRINPHKPRLQITEFKVNNQLVRPAREVSGRVILDRKIEFTQSITLEPADRVISFSIAGLHQAAPSKIRYRYRLFPFEKEWTEVGADQRFINYTNIPPQTYELQLECTDLTGNWEGDEKILTLHVLPPVWGTTWFKALLVGLILVLTLVIIHLRTRALSRKKRLLSMLVKERTQQLEEKTRELAHINQQVRYRNAELITQKQEIERMSARIHELDQSKLTFFTNISHEFRTPLSLILGQTENLMDRLRHLEISQVRSGLKVVFGNAQRLTRLINQLLEIRRMESGQVKLAFRQTDVPRFGRELLGLFQPVADAKHISLVFRSSEPRFMTGIDPDKLEKILYNLLSNAFKHTPRHGRVVLRIDRNEDHKVVEYRVINSGEGIAQQDLPHIFDRFYKVNAREVSGQPSSGIGLSLVKDLVEAHNGKIEVCSESEGTCFVVRLPIQDMPRQEMDEGLSPGNFAFSRAMIEHRLELEPVPSLATQPRSDEPAVPTGVTKSKILVVEDHPEMRHFLASSLGQQYEVLLAENGTSGLEMAKEHGPDMIISDVMMPGMDGFTLTQLLKADVQTSHIPVLLLTARAESGDQITGLEKGANDYVCKPFSIKALELKIGNLLETRAKFVESLRQSLPRIPKHIQVETVDQGLLDRILAVVEAHLDDTSFNGDQLAYEVGMSKGSLYRKLKTLTGMTVNIFIRTIRLRTAAQFLENGTYNISQVAYAVGFENPKYFSVCFKELFSETPRAYMLAHQEGKKAS